MNDQQISVVKVENYMSTSNGNQHIHNSGQTVVVITGSPHIITPFGIDPQVVACPYCHYEMTTITETTPTMKTHLLALLLCIFSCWICCCCCCPYCINFCQGKNHYCSNCGALLGEYKN